LEIILHFIVRVINDVIYDSSRATAIAGSAVVTLHPAEF
jgi:hypothetical protein